MTANRISEIFGVRLTKKLRGKLAAVVEQIEHGHHVFRVNFKTALLRQYEKFSRFLRNELLSNNLQDFGPRKGLDHVRQKFQTITDRFAGFQAQTLNVHVDFPLVQRLALPITIGTIRYPGIRIQDVRVIRLLEVLLHGGMTVGGWTAQQIHQATLENFRLRLRLTASTNYAYDLRKLKVHGVCLSADHQRRTGRTPIHVLSQAPLRTLGQHLFPSLARPQSPAEKQTRNRLTTKLKRRFRISSSCWQPDVNAKMLKYSCL
jgi:hypothetical protein